MPLPLDSEQDEHECREALRLAAVLAPIVAARPGAEQRAAILDAIGTRAVTIEVLRVELDGEGVAHGLEGLGVR